MQKVVLTVFIAFLALCSLCACSQPVVKPTEEDVTVAQDIIIGAADDDSDFAAFEPQETLEDFAEGEQQSNEELEAYKSDLEDELQALTDKLENLKWLKKSYEEENPADMAEKLAQYDQWIAETEQTLNKLQERFDMNEQEVNGEI